MNFLFVSDVKAKIHSSRVQAIGRRMHAAQVEPERIRTLRELPLEDRAIVASE